uniref:Ig-like domain-containing protein n=1 Tax=Anas zonorhyncha TaxID=75864 RepID=A0A8B9URW7_9AVES
DPHLRHRFRWVPLTPLWGMSGGATETALLTTDPPWSTIFRGESVTLRCRGSQPSGQQPTTWYHNDKILARTATDTYRITNARQKQTGTYKCQSPGSVASNPITLIVSYDPLSIRKAVVLVLGHHELGFGDFWPPYPCTMHLFYRIVGILYHRICRIMEFSMLKSHKQNPSFLSPELFSSPVLSVASSAETLEGSPLNLSCVTHLSPHSPRSILWYLFYRNGTVLRGPKTSSKYHIPSAQRDDDGHYYCVASNGGVPAQSPRLQVTVVGDLGLGLRAGPSPSCKAKELGCAEQDQHGASEWLSPPKVSQPRAGPLHMKKKMV